MKRIIYHGSSHIIKVPEYGFGKRYNDYGLGFYCTENNDMAKEWGVSETANGYSNCYEIDLEGLSILDLNDEKYSMLHWLAVLLENRSFSVAGGLAFEAREYILENFSVNYKDSDIIIGYRADDSYFSYAQDFINGGISYRQLCNAMKLGKLGLQFVLKSKRAFEAIHFISYEEADFHEWYDKKAQRDNEARREYFDVERNKRQRGDLYITSILDQEMKGDDQRLR